MHPHGATILITGASSGIGAAAAEAFDRAGAKVALVARRREVLERLAEGMTDALVIPADLSDVDQARAAVEKAMAHFGSLDVLINNAAKIQVKHSDALSAEDLAASLDTNFVGPMVATQLAARAMVARGRGHIINVGSPGYLLGLPMMASYTASKAAMSAWTRTLQAEWADSPIDVTEFFPGNVDTGPVADSDIGEIDAEAFQDPKQSALARWLARPQTPEEVAGHLIACVKNPRATVYSSPAMRFGVMLGLFAGLRTRLGARMAQVVRHRKGVSVFSQPIGTPRVKKSGGSPKKRTAKKKTPTATAAAKSSKPVKKKVEKKSAAKRSTAKKAAAKKRVAAKKKPVALSADATARVRAAAKRAAAAAEKTAKKEGESEDS